jgi:hypothetical protein
MRRSLEREQKHRAKSMPATRIEKNHKMLLYDTLRTNRLRWTQHEFGNDRMNGSSTRQERIKHVSRLLHGPATRRLLFDCLFWNGIPKLKAVIPMLLEPGQLLLKVSQHYPCYFLLRVLLCLQIQIHVAAGCVSTVWKTAVEAF